jgi:hypothetical protein
MANGEGLVEFYAMPSYLDTVNLPAKPLFKPAPKVCAAAVYEVRWLLRAAFRNQYPESFLKQLLGPH